ncbi:polyamine ABC transporter substrate-binding protein [Antribacter gilvus]|uniref:polyamine ABC transporter substrate-binding protein n=1 Tax=Antribacter gilvus TaxID=2304675 RepID=UPI0013DEA5CF|nr:spermidine/putrescine ABC transporter substrate-binding protein [Antribacter gilvus]
MSASTRGRATRPAPDLRILVSAASAPRVTRRALLGGFAVLGGASVLSACASGAAAGPVAPDGKLEKSLNVYSWGDYEAPDNVQSFQDETGVSVQIDAFASNEELVAKLTAARGTSGYDVVVPTGVYVPAMVSAGLLGTLDHSLLPNLAHVEDQYRDQPWDPGNAYTVPKAWGTTGFVYDTRVITRDLTGWADFLDAAANEASGSVAVLDDAIEVASIWLLANGHDLNTTDEAVLAQCAEALVAGLSPHVRAFASTPQQNIVNNDFALIQAYNGDARWGMLDGDTDAWRWVYPAEGANRWMDTWAITAGCQSPDAAHVFIDSMLDPEVSYWEMDWNGYPTGVAGLAERAAEEGLELPGMVFPPDDVLGRLTAGQVTEAQTTLVEILGRVQAAAGTA